MNVINCTPHEINLLTEEANVAYPPSGIVTRVNATSVLMPSVLPYGSNHLRGHHRPA